MFRQSLAISVATKSAAVCNGICCRRFQYESPKTIHVLENASVAQNVSYIRACNPDTESPIYYYLIGLISFHILTMLFQSG